MIASGSNETKQFQAIGFQLHSPSEHYYNNRLYDAELQLVFKVKESFARENEPFFAVVSILFEAIDGEESVFFESIKDTLSIQSLNMFKAIEQEFSMQDKYFHYKGSMTVPPCSETVSWHIMANPLPMSILQLSTLSLHFRINSDFARGRGNNRRLQKLKERRVTLHEFANELSIDISKGAFFKVNFDTDVQV